MAFKYDKNVLLWIKNNADTLDETIENGDPDTWRDLIATNISIATNTAHLAYFIKDQLGYSWEEIFLMMGHATGRLTYETWDDESKIPLDKNMVWPEGAWKWLPNTFFRRSDTMETFTSLAEGFENTCFASFEACSKLRRVEFKSCKDVGRISFHDCPNLSEVILPDGLIRVGEGAFSECPKLDVLELPISANTLEKDIVSGNTKLRIRGLSPKEAKKHLTEYVWIAPGYRNIYKKLLV